MATSSDPIIGIITQGDSPLLSRAVTINDSGTERVAVQDDISTITYRVYDHQTGEVTDGAQALTIADVIDDTPPTSGLLDARNFSFQVDGSTYLTKGNRRRKVQVTFTLTGGQRFTRTWVLWTENVAG